MTQNPGFGIYVHWPFCAKKCPYCDYNSHVRDATMDHDAWAQAYISELAYLGNQIDQREEVTSVFFGGGTPSLMAPETVERVLIGISKYFDLSPEIEVTLEANPTSSEAQKFQAFKSAGVNRLSIGVQALNDKDLKFLGREHNVAEAIETIETASNVFDRFSFDLIYGRPEQSLKAWEEELRGAIDFAVGHISLYQLSVEPGTAFQTLYKRGAFEMPSDDHEAALYDMTADILGQFGFNHYEVSSYARAGEESRHNLVYWRYGNYLGLGPGAHGRVVLGEQKFETRNHAAPEIWLEKTSQEYASATKKRVLSPFDQIQEFLMMGLRLEEGIDLSRFEKTFNSSLSEHVNTKKLQSFIEEGYFKQRDNKLIASRQGRLVLESLLKYILV